MADTQGRRPPWWLSPLYAAVGISFLIMRATHFWNFSWFFIVPLVTLCAALAVHTRRGD